MAGLGGPRPFGTHPPDLANCREVVLDNGERAIWVDYGDYLMRIFPDAELVGKIVHHNPSPHAPITGRSQSTLRIARELQGSEKSASAILSSRGPKYDINDQAIWQCRHADTPTNECSAPIRRQLHGSSTACHSSVSTLTLMCHPYNSGPQIL